MRVILQCPDECKPAQAKDKIYTLKDYGDKEFIRSFERNPNEAYEAKEVNLSRGDLIRWVGISGFSYNYPADWFIFLDPLPPPEPGGNGYSIPTT
jgi:hypothetical protein